jgi:hypothetical protein
MPYEHVLVLDDPPSILEFPLAPEGRCCCSHSLVARAVEKDATDCNQAELGPNFGRQACRALDPVREEINIDDGGGARNDFESSKLRSFPFPVSLPRQASFWFVRRSIASVLRNIRLEERGQLSAVEKRGVGMCCDEVLLCLSSYDLIYIEMTSQGGASNSTQRSSTPLQH